MRALVLTLALLATAWGETLNLQALRSCGRPRLLMTWNRFCHCCREAESRLSELQRRYPEVPMQLLDAHPADHPDQVQAFLAEQGLQLEVLFDPQGRWCEAFHVQTTTTALLWDEKGQLLYVGNLDQADKALSQMLRGQTVEPAVTVQRGCPILAHPAPGP